MRKLASVTGDILKWLESLRAGVLAIRWVHVAPCGTKGAGFVYLAPEVLGSPAAAPAEVAPAPPPSRMGAIRSHGASGSTLIASEAALSPPPVPTKDEKPPRGEKEDSKNH